MTVIGNSFVENFAQASGRTEWKGGHPQIGLVTFLLTQAVYYTGKSIGRVSRAADLMDATIGGSRYRFDETARV